MAFNDFTPGHLFSLQWLAETATITEATDGGEPILPALPSGTPALVGQINAADIVDTYGKDQKRAAGSPFSVYDQAKGRDLTMTVPLRITNADFLQACCFNTGGTGGYGLDNIALYHGIPASLAATTFTADVWRLAQCNSIQAQLGFGSGAELQANVEMWGVYPMTAASVAVPSFDDLTTLGTPASAHDIYSIFIGQSGGSADTAGTGGTDVRQTAAGFNFTENHMLERKDYRPFYTTAGTPGSVAGGLAASLCTWGLMSNGCAGQGEFTFKKKVFTGTNDWGDIEAVIGNQLWRWKHVTVSERHQQGVEPSTQMTFTVPVQFRYLEIYTIA